MKIMKWWHFKKRRLVWGSTLAIVAVSIFGVSEAPSALALNPSRIFPVSSGNTQKAVPAAKARQYVAFVCSGNAPGVTISYGSDSSEYSAPRSPFSRTLPLNRSAEYYDVSAQLGGSGSITCSVTAHWNQGGRSHAARKVGSASGGYNIADPEICSNFTGGWQGC